jgi:hypothetical protein
MIVDRFLADLEAMGINAVAPDDPLHDTEWMDLLETAYPSPAPPIPSAR